MATKKAVSVDTVEAVVLCDCGFGKVGDIVRLTKSQAETGAKHGMIDLHPAAIKAAKG